MKEKTNANTVILIVEDDEAMLEVLIDEFKREGFKTLSAKNGVEGLDTALEKHPDIILLDILMPEMDGLTMLTKLRDDKWGKDVPVILLTNYSDMDKISESVQLQSEPHWVWVALFMEQYSLPGHFFLMQSVPRALHSASVHWQPQSVSSSPHLTKYSQ